MSINRGEHSERSDRSATPPPADAQVPEHIKVIQSLSAAPRSPNTLVHFSTVMWKNALLKIRQPVGSCLETFLPVLFVLGLVGIWTAVDEGVVPSTHYVNETAPVTEIVDPFKLVAAAACTKPGETRIPSIRQCTQAEVDNTTSPLVCTSDTVELPAGELCFSGGVKMLDLVLAWVGFRGVRKIPSVNEMILMQWVANASLTTKAEDDAFQTALSAIGNGGYLHFAPDTAEVRAFADYLNQTNSLFQYAYGDVFETTAGARDAASNRLANTAWGVISFDQLDAAGLDCTIHMNRSGVPWTVRVIETGNGIGRFRPAQYIASGFMTLQDTVSRYYVEEIKGATAPPPLVHIPMPFKEYDTSSFLEIIGSLAALFLAFGYLYPVSQLVKRIVEEKEGRVREAMMIMGLSTAPFYCSWVVTYFVLQLVTALVIAILLKITMLPKSDFFIMFLLYLLFGLSNITFSSMMSSFFSKARAAAIAAPVVYFIAAVPSFALPDTTPAGVLVLLSLLSPTAFANGMKVLVDQEISGGSTWPGINDSFNDYPISVVYVMLALDTVLYMLLTLYFDAVLPSEWGTRAHPCCCIINPFRWCFGKKESDGQLEGDESAFDGRDPKGVFEPDTTNATPSVQLRGLRKEFVLPNGETMLAVNNLTFNLYENQVFALLGHNGAGKTTAMNVMTGMLEMDGGDCRYHGHSVRDELDRVRREIGYCPQHNILWDDLTCREHLYFFARLKGLEGDLRDKAVEAMLKAVDLENKGDKYPTELSGGQKRKLSVGIAFVGGSRVVFLDEPSAGMDVAARRHTWELIKLMTPGRTIVLTTHYMDEADLLGNTIGIMAKGRLKCSGSSLFLKSRLGVGYALNIACGHNAQNSDEIISALKNYVPTLDVMSNGGGEIGLRLPMDAVPNFPALLAYLEENSEALGLRGHGISVTTLEEVFLKIGHDTEAADNLTQPNTPMVPNNNTMDPSQVHVLMPPEGEAPKVSEEERKLIFTDEVAHATPTAGGQFSVLFGKRVNYVRRDTRTIIMQAILPIVCITFAMLLSLIEVPQTPRFVFGNYGDYSGSADLVAANCPSDYSTYVGQTSAATYVYPDGITRAGELSTLLLDEHDRHAKRRLTAYLCNDSSIGYGVVFSNSSIYRTSGPHQIAEYHRDHIHYETREPTLPISFATHPLDLSPFESKVIEGFLTVFVAIFVMIPFTFIPSTFVSFIVKEREGRALQLQRASGMNYIVYWCANYLFDLTSFFVTAILAIIIFAVFGREEYVGDGASFAAMLVLFMLYGAAGVGGAYLCNFAFESHSTAQNIVMLGNFICGFMLVLMSFILDIIESTKDAAEVLRYFFRIVPSFCLGEGILNMAQRDLSNSQNATDDGPWAMSVIGWPCLYLAIEIPLLFGLVLYIDSPTRRAQQHSLVGGTDTTEDDTAEPEDDDVAVERREVESGSRDDDYVVVKNLRKFYPGNGGVLAVRDISFGIHKGEVFGFLGTNGAGKTTTMSILCGDQMPTRGTATIAGYDIVKQGAETRKLIGYCPQFDGLHDLLTVDEHLHLYAGLHGLAGALRTEVTERLVQVCGLAEHRVKESRSLSGGNKRKLSVAISLLGAPQVVFLDEPSAGMDPVARRTMWGVIEQIAAHCSVVLTTHHLEEIEALASRTAIMVDGELKCIGPLQHLKTKFGSGFEMSIRVDKEENVEALKAFLQNNIANAALQEERGTKLTYALPQDTKLSVTFELVERTKQLLGVTDYSVSQTSLESVFLRISAAAKNRPDDD